MGREALLICQTSPIGYTPNEPWTFGRSKNSHWYDAQADFAVSRLGSGAGKCLVIGSPIFEVQELEEAGWDVTYLDVRKAPEQIKKFVHADATAIPLPSEQFEAVSSTCVLCHVGMSRYGDPSVDDGDVKMLCEIGRVLKPDGMAALTFGPVSAVSDFGVAKLGNCHRIYTVDEAKRMCELAGLKVLEMAVWDCGHYQWRDFVPFSCDMGQYYLSVLVKRG